MQEIFDYSGSMEIPPEVLEKNKIRRLALVCGLGLLALFVIMCFWGNIYFRITGLFGISPKVALNFANHPFISQLFHILISAIMIVVPFIVVAKALGFRPTAEIPLKAPQKGTFWLSVGAGAGVCLFSNFATNLGGSIFEIFGVEFPGNASKLPEGGFGMLAVVIATAFFPAFLEEFVMRGIVMGVLRRFGDAFAIFCSAFVFGIMHASAEQIVFAFVVGLILGHITVKSGSLWPAIAVHFINNLISVSFSYLNWNDIAASLLLVALFAVLFAISVVSLIALQKKDKDYLRFVGGEVTDAKKIIWFLTSPTIIISTAAAILIAFFVR